MGMNALKLLPRYIGWHYSVAFADMAQNAKNSLLFLYNFFSINVLFKTLFAPWERMGDSYKKGFNPEDFFATLAVNTVMRVVGFIMRTFLIILGSISILCDVVFICISFLVWIVSPFLIILFFVAGMINLFY